MYPSGTYFLYLLLLRSWEYRKCLNLPRMQFKKIIIMEMLVCFYFLCSLVNIQLKSHPVMLSSRFLRDTWIRVLMCLHTWNRCFPPLTGHWYFPLSCEILLWKPKIELLTTLKINVQNVLSIVCSWKERIAKELALKLNAELWSKTWINSASIHSFWALSSHHFYISCNTLWINLGVTCISYI